jgi:hypothetical protein
VDQNAFREAESGYGRLGENAHAARPQHGGIKNAKALGLVNGRGVAIHHDAVSARFFKVAFIFDKCRPLMVNATYPPHAALTPRSCCA